MDKAKNTVVTATSLRNALEKALKTVLESDKSTKGLFEDFMKSVITDVETLSTK